MIEIAGGDDLLDVESYELPLSQCGLHAKTAPQIEIPVNHVTRVRRERDSAVRPPFRVFEPEPCSRLRSFLAVGARTLIFRLARPFSKSWTM
jgi:hypothetical protein